MGAQPHPRAETHLKVISSLKIVLLKFSVCKTDSTVKQLKGVTSLLEVVLAGVSFVSLNKWCEGEEPVPQKSYSCVTSSHSLPSNAAEWAFNKCLI